MLSGLGDWYQAAAETAIALNTEWLRFCQQRLKEDTALFQQLSPCRAPDEFLRVYADFWSTATDDYQMEFAELARLCSGGANESTKGSQHARNGRNLEEPTPPAGH
jgi:hypothetical protein